MPLPQTEMDASHTGDEEKEGCLFQNHLPISYWSWSARIDLGIFVISTNHYRKPLQKDKYHTGNDSFSFNKAVPGCTFTTHTHATSHHFPRFMAVYKRMAKEQARQSQQAASIYVVSSGIAISSRRFPVPSTVQGVTGRHSTRSGTREWDDVSTYFLALSG
ncbi:hypothetical protein C8R42DRAFT_640207 [Lentinula raphanica]|nr:hypothetical protein C8R42DRAFT_640207 [Lentinula raphanica]